MKQQNKIIIANWKMHGDRARLTHLTRAVGDAWGRISGKGDSSGHAAPDIVLCPSFPYLDTISRILSAGVYLGAQDVSPSDPVVGGAQTGDVSSEMLLEFGCSYVIIGHSERRLRYGETNEHIREKASTAVDVGMIPILCVGETAQDRARGASFDIVDDQILETLPEKVGKNLVIAYEPVWAIGTGQSAQDGDIIAMHEFILGRMKEKLAPDVHLRMVYGGSVRSANAAGILALPVVDGVLVGGASLQSDEFCKIIESAIMIR